MIIYFLLLLVAFGVGSVFINKIRNLLNLVSLCLIYGCYLLINYVPSANWAGFVIICLLYLQMVANFVIMHFESKNLRVDPD
jgi:hypothetical protein